MLDLVNTTRTDVKPGGGWVGSWEGGGGGVRS